jgi:hypothetical protein
MYRNDVGSVPHGLLVSILQLNYERPIDDGLQSRMESLHTYRPVIDTVTRSMETKMVMSYPNLMLSSLLLLPPDPQDIIQDNTRSFDLSAIQRAQARCGVVPLNESFLGAFEILCRVRIYICQLDAPCLLHILFFTFNPSSYILLAQASSKICRPPQIHHHQPALTYLSSKTNPPLQLGAPGHTNHLLPSPKWAKLRKPSPTPIW